MKDPQSWVYFEFYSKLKPKRLEVSVCHAVISGKYIGNAIKDSEIPDVVFEKYTNFLDGMKKELALYNRGAKVLYKKQRMSYWMLKLFFGKRFMDGYSTGKTLTEIIKGKYPFPSI